VGESAGASPHPNPPHKGEGARKRGWVAEARTLRDGEREAADPQKYRVRFSAPGRDGRTENSALKRTLRLACQRCIKRIRMQYGMNTRHMRTDGPPPRPGPAPGPRRAGLRRRDPGSSPGTRRPTAGFPYRRARIHCAHCGVKVVHAYLFATSQKSSGMLPL
jgi:hypothetical protein